VPIPVVYAMDYCLYRGYKKKKKIEREREREKSIGSFFLVAEFISPLVNLCRYAS